MNNAFYNSVISAFKRGSVFVSTLLGVVHATSPNVTIYNTSNWSKVTNPSTLPGSTGLGVAFNKIAI